MREAARTIEAVGVRINLLPHAVRDLPTSAWPTNWTPSRRPRSG
ncbi:hypothetical protein ABZ372_36690 [Streptomyces sp. NPDC005921]